MPGFNRRMRYARSRRFFYLGGGAPGGVAVAEIDLNAPEVQEAISKAVAAQVEKETAGLKANRDEILAEKKRVEKRLKELPEDFDPEEYKNLRAAQVKAAEDRAKAEGNFKALETQLTERHSKELAKREAREKSLTSALEDYLIDGAATRALAEAKGAVDLLLPHVAAQMAVIEEDGRFVAVVVDDHGNPRLSEQGKPGTRMTVEELVQAMKADQRFGRGFEGSGVSGSGASKSEGGGGTVRVIPAGDNQAFLDNLDAIAAGKVRVE